MRTSKKHGDSFEIPHTGWVVELRTASGEGGYYCFSGPDGPSICRELSGKVHRCKSRRDAEQLVKHLVKEYGLDIEEATPLCIGHEETKSLWLDDTEWPDGLSVEQLENGKRYLLVRDDAEEFTTDDLDENVADAIVRLLEKMKRKLAPKGS